MNQPNIILMLTDDQGYGDLGRHGNPVLHTDTHKDPGQETNLAAEHPDLVQAMAAGYDAWWKERLPELEAIS